MITIKNEKEIEKMERAGRLLAEILNKVIKEVDSGVTTFELNQLAENLILQAGAIPAFKGFKSDGRVFPAALCTSINQEVVHGIPNQKNVLQRGDIIGIDCGLKLDGFYADMARTIPVGKPSDKVAKLLTIARECLEKGTNKAQAGARLGSISNAIQTHAEKNGFSVVRNLAGHGIGKDLHEKPDVFNYGDAETGPVLKPGMTLAIEPMINVGHYDVKTKEDGWTIVTKDDSLSAHFENSILITETDAEILTRIK